MKLYKERGLRQMTDERLEALAKERLGVDVDLDSDKDMLVKAILSTQDEPQEPTGPTLNEVRISKMNDLARRIWEGQSISEDLGWRVGRVKEGLDGQGYTDLLEHLELPEKTFKRYM